MRLNKNTFFNSIDQCEFQKKVIECVPQTLYKYFSIPSEDDERDKRFMQLENEELWFSRKEILNDPFELEHLSLNSASKLAKDYYANKTKELEFLCLTNSPSNKLMWSYYAQAYTGYCVAFSVEKLNNIYPVIYDDSLPDLSGSYQNFYNSIHSLDFGSCNKDVTRIIYPLISKDKCWEYESEFRMIFSHCIDGKQGHLYDSKTTGLHISRIIAGSLCSKDNLKRLNHVIATINDRRLNEYKKMVVASLGCLPPQNILAESQQLLPGKFSVVQLKQIEWNNHLELIEKDCEMSDKS